MECTIGLGYLPIIWSLFTLSGPIVGYAVSVSDGHVYAFLPAISDIGSVSPEAYLFSMLMNISIFFALVNFYVRYHQCSLQIKYCRDIKETLSRLNNVAVAFAGLSVFGAVIVANVQSREDHFMLEIHDTGAVLLFTFGGFYFWIQTTMSYLMRPYGIYTALLCHLRIALTTIITLCSIFFFTTTAYGYQEFVKNNHNHKITRWMPGDGGYVLHVLGNAAEWLALFAFVGLSLSFFSEFQCVKMLVECREIRPHIISAYDELSEYATLKLSAEERYISDDGQGN